MNFLATKPRLLTRFAAAVLFVWTLQAHAAEDPVELELRSILSVDTVSQGLFRQVTAPADLQFPRDHGPHPDFRSEWWYFTAVLTTAEGREFGTQFTLFRYALHPPQTVSKPSAWRTGQIYMAHFAISDVERETHTEYERISRAHPELAGVRTEPFRGFIDNWELRSRNDEFAPLQLDVAADKTAVLLTIDETKNMVLHGDRGLSTKQPGSASYYYSIPRLRVTGYLTTPEGTFEVAGDGWLDREWTSGVLHDGVSGWDWFSLQFDSGDDVVLFSLRDAATNAHAYPVGIRIGAAGETSAIVPSDWSARPVRTWGDWPLEWELTLDDRQYRVVPAFDDQLMRTSIRYWEGVVHVYEDDHQTGKGYMELTGY